MKKRRKSEIFFINHTERSRTYKKKIKRRNKETRSRNKTLISLYPWLAPVSWVTGKPVVDKRFDLISVWDELPKGWTNVFGRMMCDEIQKSLEKKGLQNKVRVDECKEKYGSARLYMAGTDETQHIISIYEAISENVCAYCGKPHSPMMNFSWIIPMCEDCFYKLQKKNEYFYRREYTDYTPEEKNWKIPNPLKWKRFSENGDTIIEEDITNRIKQIEHNWEKNHEKYLKKIEKKNQKIHKQKEE